MYIKKKACCVHTSHSLDTLNASLYKRAYELTQNYMFHVRSQGSGLNKDYMYTKVTIYVWHKCKYLQKRCLSLQLLPEFLARLALWNPAEWFYRSKPSPSEQAGQHQHSHWHYISPSRTAQSVTCLLTSYRIQKQYWWLNMIKYGTFNCTC